MNGKLLIVTATREPLSAFHSATMLGRSVGRLAFDERIELRVAAENSEGLPRFYNRQICEENRGRILLFVHDDVWLDDWFVCDRLVRALDSFDLVGIAGNTHRVPRQPAWGYVSEPPFVADQRSNLSGVVAHGTQPGGAVSRYGVIGRKCALLDGVFLAARCETLLEKSVRFDELFDFHFYDMDFCRSAERANLRIGTWPIAVTHQSDGLFGTPVWRRAFQAYQAKWGD